MLVCSFVDCGTILIKNGFLEVHAGSGGFSEERSLNKCYSTLQMKCTLCFSLSTFCHTYCWLLICIRGYSSIFTLLMRNLVVIYFLKSVVSCSSGDFLWTWWFSIDLATRNFWEPEKHYIWCVHRFYALFGL